MIYPFTFTCPRDWDCFEFLVESAEALHDAKMAPFTTYYDPKELPDDHMKAFASTHQVTFQPRLPDFAPWSDRSGWSKLHGFIDAAKQGAENDYVVHIDSDCFFTSNEILDQIVDCEVAGFEHGEKRPVDILRRFWTWTSGAFQVARVDCVRRLEETYVDRLMYQMALTAMKNEGLSYVNDDVVMSFLFALAGMENKNLGQWGGVADLEVIALGKEKARSLMHYANDTKTFLGFPKTPKWDFPKILRARGINLFKREGK